MANITMSQIMDYLGPYFMKKKGTNPLGGNLIPDVAEAWDIGSPTKPVKTIYAANVITPLVNSAAPGTGDGGTGTPSTDYIRRDGTLSLTGNLAVEASVTIDGVDLSAHVADPNAHHNRSHNITSTSDHTITGDPWSVVGVHATNANVLAIHASSDDATNAKILRSNSSGRLGLNQLMTQEIVSKTGVAGGHLKLNPVTGGSVLIPNVKQIRSETFAPATYPIGGWSIHNRVAGITPTSMSELMINRIIADELRVKIFVADETRVDRGVWILAKGYGLLSRPFVTPKAIDSNLLADDTPAYIYFENSPVVTGAYYLLPMIG